jgi:hypothetical protein
VTHGQEQPKAVRCFDQVVGLCECRRKRLLDQNVTPGFKRQTGDLVVRGRCHRYDNGIALPGQLASVEGSYGEAVCHFPSPRAICVGHADQIAVRHFAENPRVNGSQPADAHHSDAQVTHFVIPRLLARMNSIM